MSLFVILGGTVVYGGFTILGLALAKMCALGDGRFDEPEDGFDEEFLASAGVQPVHMERVR